VILILKTTNEPNRLAFNKIIKVTITATGLLTTEMLLGISREIKLETRTTRLMTKRKTKLMPIKRKTRKTLRLKMMTK